MRSAKTGTWVPGQVGERRRAPYLLWGLLLPPPSEPPVMRHMFLPGYLAGQTSQQAGAVVPGGGTIENRMESAQNAFSKINPWGSGAAE